MYHTTDIVPDSVKEKEGHLGHNNVSWYTVRAFRNNNNSKMFIYPNTIGISYEIRFGETGSPCAQSKTQTQIRLTKQSKETDLSQIL